MKKMIFEPVISGHVLEWLHHIYEDVASREDEYFFVVPEKFKTERDRLRWSDANNIKFVYLTEREVQVCADKNLLKAAFNASWIVRKYVAKYEASDVFFIFLMKLIPFLPFFLPSGISISGVVYRVFLYDDSKKGFRLILEKMRYWVLAKEKNIKSVFVLNDAHSAAFFNEKYKAKKFKYLPDPIPNLEGPFRNLRGELGISNSKKVFFQFGTIDSRKNSLTILKAFMLMSEEELNDKAIVFSGRIDPNIRKEFFSLVEGLKNKMTIVVLEGFASYERLNDLCFSSDCLLTLYDNVCQSSGTIGYGAFFRKTVIGPSRGLLGRLIKENDLGITIDKITPENVKTAMCSRLIPAAREYCETHQIGNFCGALSL